MANIQEIDYAGGTNAVYIGVALSGTSLASPNWQIKKIDYDTNANPISITWANGSARSGFIWNNRATYSYS